MVVLLLRQPASSKALAGEIRAIDPSIACVRDAEEVDPAEIDAVLGWQMREGLAPRLPNLKLVCASAAGVEKMIPADLPPNVAVSRVVDPRVNLGIAQYVALMALRHARELPCYERQARERLWKRSPVDAASHRVGILGMGETGTTIASALLALGFAVQGWSTRRRPELPFPTHEARELDAFLRSSDILVNALPLTPATAGLLNAERLARLPKGAYLINVARGIHIVETDLIAAVEGGHLAGAALDVQGTEPLPAEDPLWSVDGITITPHIAGQASVAVIAAQFVESYQAMRRGEPVPRVVDRSKGY